MYKNIVFVGYLSNYGGIETLILRMTKWLTNNKISVIIICDSDRTENATLVDEITNAGACIYRCSFRKYSNIFDSSMCECISKDSLFIVFSFPALLVADVFVARDISNSLIFYDPHQYGLFMDYWSQNEIIKPVLRLASIIITKRMSRRHQIIYMDYLCKNRTLKDMHIRDKYDDDVVFLPMEILPLKRQEIEAKRKKEEFVILSICRMTFPFKGYVIGLIDEFVELYEKNPKLRLILIGTGENQDELQSKLDKVAPKVRESIKWIPGVPYSKLAEYFDKAHLYVGMGTTVADAVNHGVPSLAIGSYTYQCQGYDFFYKDATNLGGLFGKNNIAGFIKSIINLDIDEYCDLVERDYAALKSVYDIESMGTAFLNYRNAKNYVFSSVERMLINLIKGKIK